MRTDTLKCGCAVAVPEEIERGSDEEEGFLRDAKLIRDVQTGISRWDAICSQCFQKLEIDI